MYTFVRFLSLDDRASRPLQVVVGPMRRFRAGEFVQALPCVQSEDLSQNSPPALPKHKKESSYNDG